jgi:hypothetical protein
MCNDYVFNGYLPVMIIILTALIVKTRKDGSQSLSRLLHLSFPSSRRPTLCGSVRGSGVGRLSRRPITKERVNLFVNGHWAFEIGEMSAIFQRDHAGIRDCLSNVLGRNGGDEFVIARNDQRRDPKALEIGK